MFADRFMKRRGNILYFFQVPCFLLTAKKSTLPRKWQSWEKTWKRKACQWLWWATGLMYQSWERSSFTMRTRGSGGCRTLEALMCQLSISCSRTGTWLSVIKCMRGSSPLETIKVIAPAALALLFVAWLCVILSNKCWHHVTLVETLSRIMRLWL